MRITEEIWKLHDAVSADPQADALLRTKCNEQRMTRTAVLREWGDPRTWPSYSMKAADQGEKK